VCAGTLCVDDNTPALQRLAVGLGEGAVESVGGRKFDEGVTGGAS